MTPRAAKIGPPDGPDSAQDWTFGGPKGCPNDRFVGSTPLFHIPPTRRRVVGHFLLNRRVEKVHFFVKG